MSAKNNKSVIILIADDDEEDRMLLKDAFEESHLLNEIYFVDDGEELTDYLYRKGQYTNPLLSPRPGMILLDLNMPKKDGREALREIKANPELRTIPIIVLTTSRAEEDIIRSYDLGVNSFITKPVTFKSLIEVVQMLGRYWLEIVELPDIKQNKE
ncbi:response regulator [Cytophagaceae bacterium DM2B3-1]|uniref:Response regulator n=1 Tax=Xanthocytophaga flava TaxID=3048013 RepID=A0ABT7CLM7_9BACT|nr:response regulator [Xanthocytophaga flavus]MDJ1468291.1 response regulator [Xanthocytophaga flavus]MDJ1494658.1 response regulator [Xanthocytophaga flavus]